MRLQLNKQELTQSLGNSHMTCLTAHCDIQFLVIDTCAEVVVAVTHLCQRWSRKQHFPCTAELKNK